MKLTNEHARFWLGCAATAALLFGGLLVGMVFDAITGTGSAGFTGFTLPIGLVLTIVALQAWGFLVSFAYFGKDVVKTRSFLGPLLAKEPPLSRKQRLLSMLPALVVSPVVAVTAGVLSWALSGGQRPFLLTVGGWATLGSLQGLALFALGQAALLDPALETPDA